MVFNVILSLYVLVSTFDWKVPCFSSFFVNKISFQVSERVRCSKHAPRSDAVGTVERESPEAIRPDVVLDEAVNGWKA